MADEVRIGVYVCHCGLNIAGVLNPGELTQFAATLSDVAFVRDILYSCSEPGQDQIVKDIQERQLNRVVVAACSPRFHETTFRRCLARANLNPFFLEMVNIREQVSWVHANQPAAALQKARDLIAAGVARARLLQPLQYIEVPVTQSALVVGGGIAGISAALDLADMGFQTYLVEREPSLGGKMAQLAKTFPTMDCSP